MCVSLTPSVRLSVWHTASCFTIHFQFRLVSSGATTIIKKGRKKKSKEQEFLPRLYQSRCCTHTLAHTHTHTQTCSQLHSSAHTHNTNFITCKARTTHTVASYKHPNTHSRRQTDRNKHTHTHTHTDTHTHWPTCAVVAAAAAAGEDPSTATLGSLHPHSHTHILRSHTSPSQTSALIDALLWSCLTRSLTGRPNCQLVNQTGWDSMCVCVRLKPPVHTAEIHHTERTSEGEREGERGRRSLHTNTLVFLSQTEL